MEGEKVVACLCMLVGH